MDPNHDYYAVLGVPPTATAGAIRTAYRKLALTLHPDRAGVASTQAFRAVAAAYEVLSDPRRRERYDAQIARDRSITPPSNVTPRSREPITRLSGPLRSLLAAGLLRTIGEDAYELWLSADEAARGGFFSVTTSAPNQFQHWISVAPGITDGTVLPSVLKIGDIRSELRLQIRVRSWCTKCNHEGHEELEGSRRNQLFKRRNQLFKRVLQE